jgi:hypothetical protein
LFGHSTGCVLEKEAQMDGVVKKKKEEMSTPIKIY